MTFARGPQLNLQVQHFQPRKWKENKLLSNWILVVEFRVSLYWPKHNPHKMRNFPCIDVDTTRCHIIKHAGVPTMAQLGNPYQAALFNTSSAFKSFKVSDPLHSTYWLSRLNRYENLLLVAFLILEIQKKKTTPKSPHFPPVPSRLPGVTWTVLSFLQFVSLPNVSPCNVELNRSPLRDCTKKSRAWR